MGRLRLRFSAQAAMVGPVYPSLLVFTSSGWTALPTHASMSTGTAALLSSLSNCCTAVLPFQLLHCCPPFPSVASSVPCSFGNWLSRSVNGEQMVLLGISKK